MGIALHIILSLSDGNSTMLSPPPSSHNPGQDKGYVVVIVSAAISVALILLSACCALLFWMCFRSRRIWSSGIFDASKEKLDVPILNRFNPLSIRGSIPEVDYRLIEAATDGFDENNVLGRGGIGRVYRACFDRDAYAAVKKFDAKDPYSETVFEHEIFVMSNVAHSNVVVLLGYCVHWETRILVYELMQGGSLEKQLHGLPRGMALTWNIRLKIALDVARGLEYLHDHCRPPVIHRDLKSSSILLDSDFNAKISGLGQAVVGDGGNGILGYEAPEYLTNGELSEKSNIYALGVLILELLMGRKPAEVLAASRCRSFATWVVPQLTDRDKIPDIVDPVIRHTMDLKHLCQVAAIAVLCVQPEPSYRPLITDIVFSLDSLVPQELGGLL